MNEKIRYNILKRLNEINYDDNFKKLYPDIKAEEYLVVKLYKSIKPKRLINILNGKAKRISTYEVCQISKALNVKLSELVK